MSDPYGYEPSSKDRAGEVSAQRLHDALEKERQFNRREHLRTRAWLVLLTAPSWGALVGAALGISGLTTAIATAAGASYAIAIKLGFLAQ